jgi:hypothetical protein
MLKYRIRKRKETAANASLLKVAEYTAAASGLPLATRGVARDLVVDVRVHLYARPGFCPRA